MVFKNGIYLIVIILFIGIGESCGDAKKIDKEKVYLERGSKVDDTEKDCLLFIENFASKLELDTSMKLDHYFKTQQSQKLLMCRLKDYRKDYRYKKAMAMMMLKMQCYFKKNGSNDTDFVRIYRWTPVLDAILNEVMYMQTGEEFGNQEIQVFAAVETKRFIARDKVLSKDKELMKLMKECF